MCAPCLPTGPVSRLLHLSPHPLLFLVFFGSDGVDVDPSNPGTLVKNLPAPQLSHYEGLFAKYLQSLPALER